MIIGIVVGIICIIIISLIIALKKNEKPKQVNVSVKPKVPPITKGRSYPWFYIKECLFYFPISTSTAYEGETKQSLIDELIEMQKMGNFEKVIEICDQLIAKDYKFSRAWIDKINAIFNSVLTGKEWNVSISRDIVNCCYNYIKSFANNYDKSVNAKHSLIPVILKRTQDIVAYNREHASETYNFEIYNMIINLYYLMPFNELLDIMLECVESGKRLDEIHDNQYAIDTIKSLTSHANMLKEKHSIAIEKDEIEELKILNKTIINDEVFSTSWIGFDIRFPANLSRVELIFKFFDYRRQEIDLSGGNNKRMTELFKNNSKENGYNVVVIGEDRIKYVTIEIYDESKKKMEESDSLEEDVEETEEVLENLQLDDKELKHDNGVKEETQTKTEHKKEENYSERKEENVPVEENDEKIEEKQEEKQEEENNSKEIEKLENVSYKIYPNFNSVKEISMSENYCLFLMKDGKVRTLGNLEKSINTEDWEHIEKIYATSYTAYAIKKDGTIIVAGKNVYDNWEYQYIWKDIQKLEPAYNHIVGLKNDGTVVASGDNTHGQCEVSGWFDIIDISASFHTVGLDKNGNVFATGANSFGECDISNWSNIEKIATGPFYTVGLRENGTVVAAGLNSCGQCNTSDWKDVKEIYVRGNVTVGLKYDGTVLVTGRNSYRFEDAKKWNDIKEVKIVNDRIIGITNEGKINYIGKPYWGRVKEDWHDISSVEANSSCILGKKEDGKLICNKTLFGMYLPDNLENFEDIKQNSEADKVVVLGKDGKVDVYCINNFDLYKWDVSKFNNIKQISISSTHLIGLKHDGTAVVAGNDMSLYFDVAMWKNLVKVEAGEKFVLGLTIDGRVMATGNNAYGQCEVGDWIDIVDVAVYGSKAIGLKSDGTVLATGYLEYDEENFVKKAQNIVGIAINNKQIMLLDSNGNVSISYNPFGEESKNISDWRNILKIVANQDSFIGLKSDKTLITTGDQDIESWKNVVDLKASGNYVVGLVKTK